MEAIVVKLTVCFEDPFWVGVYEREDCGRYEAAKVIFGAEPKTYDVYDFVLRHWRHLRFSPAVRGEAIGDTHLNPKRAQRAAAKEMQGTGIGTKAQQALQQLREAQKTEHKTRSKEAVEAEKERRYELKHEKKKEKHRGH